MAAARRPPLLPPRGPHGLINDNNPRQMTWVGTAEANPDEEPLPFPPELKFTQVRASPCCCFALG